MFFSKQNLFCIKGKYEGNWRFSCRDGYGQMDFANGQQYSGLWMDDKPTGLGRLNSLDGSSLLACFDGDLNKVVGGAVFTWPDGAVECTPKFVGALPPQSADVTLCCRSILFALRTGAQSCAHRRRGGQSGGRHDGQARRCASATSVAVAVDRRARRWNVRLDLPAASSDDFQGRRWRQVPLALQPAT